MAGDWRIIGVILAQVLSAGAMGCAPSLSPELDTASRHSLALYRQSRFAEAAPFADLAVRLAKKDIGVEHPKYPALLTLAGEVYRGLGRYERAIGYERRALALREKILGPGHKDVASSLNRIASL